MLELFHFYLSAKELYSGDDVSTVCVNFRCLLFLQNPSEVLFLDVKLQTKGYTSDNEIVLFEESLKSINNLY